MVYLREVLSSSASETSDAALKIPLGVDVVGQPFVADLTKMPHLLVAGATGSGRAFVSTRSSPGSSSSTGPNLSSSSWWIPRCSSCPRTTASRTW
jgi:hypothetical protein